MRIGTAARRAMRDEAESLGIGAGIIPFITIWPHGGWCPEIRARFETIRSRRESRQHPPPAIRFLNMSSV